MTRALLLAALVALAPSCFAPTTPACAGVAPNDDGERIGTLRARGIDWRVQLADLPDGCDGITTWSPTRHTVTLARPLERGTALHEVGHVLLGRDHLPDDAGIMSESYPAEGDITPADLAHCRDVAVCSADARVIAAPALASDQPADVVAWAALRWSGVIRPEFRVTFTLARETTP